MSQSQRELTKERLIEAGKRVIFQKGFHRARVSDITEEAGLAHGTFYLYFKTKDDFLLELLRAVRGEMINLMDEGIYLISSGSVEEGKKLVFLRTFSLMIEERELAKIFFFEAICVNRKFQEFYREGKDIFLNKLRRALELLNVEKPEIKAHILVGTARHLVESAILTGEEVTGTWEDVLRELGLSS